MDFQRLETRVILDEGFRDEAYLDTEGVWTVGFGTTRWLDGSPVQEGDTIDQEVARALLRSYLWKCAMDCQRDYPKFNLLDDVRQEVLVNMRYNLGRKGLRGFKRMNDAVFHFDYEAWAREMMDSKWWNQVGQRAVRLQKAVLRGDWR